MEEMMQRAMARTGFANEKLMRFMADTIQKIHGLSDPGGHPGWSLRLPGTGKLGADVPCTKRPGACRKDCSCKQGFRGHRRAGADYEDLYPAISGNRRKRMKNSYRERILQEKKKLDPATGILFSFLRKTFTVHCKRDCRREIRTASFV